MPTSIVQKLQEEIQALERELNHELPRELKRARALGDLSENAEFIMAKQRQDYVGARLSQLKKRLAELSLVNFSNIPKDKIAFGSKVVLYDVDRDSEIEYKLVTSEEAGQQGLNLHDLAHWPWLDGEEARGFGQDCDAERGSGV